MYGKCCGPARKPGWRTSRKITAADLSPDTPEFQRLNPNSPVPVLLDDDFVLWESNSICRYLARKAERWDLLPAEPQPAAEVEHWMDWQATEFNTARAMLLWGWCVKIRAFRIRWRLKSIAARPLRAHC